MGTDLTFNADGAAGTAASHVLTNTLTSTAFNIAGITFNSGAPAYTMGGNSFNLTTGMTNNSGVLQTFNNSGVTAVTGDTGGTVLNATGLTVSGGTTWNVGTGGITLSGLQFNTINNSSSTTTVNGTGGTLTIAYLGLGTMTSSRLVQTFNGSGNISVGTMVAGGSASAANDSFVYSGTGTFSLTGSHTDTFGDTISSGTFALSGSLNAILTISGTANFTESSAGVFNRWKRSHAQQHGTSTLSGLNTYTGGTTVTAGTLNVTGTLGNTAIAVNGGTFSLQNAGAVKQNTITVGGRGDGDGGKRSQWDRGLDGDLGHCDALQGE